MAFLNKYKLLRRALTLALSSLCFIFNVPLHSAEKTKEDSVLLYSLERRSGLTNEWRLTISDAKRSLWLPAKAKQPPLSLSKALQIARKDGNPKDKLESIGIFNIPGAEYVAPFDKVYYYRCIFQVGPFDRRACLILMDGTILQPMP